MVYIWGQLKRFVGALTSSSQIPALKVMMGDIDMVGEALLCSVAINSALKLRRIPHQVDEKWFSKEMEGLRREASRYVSPCLWLAADLRLVAVRATVVDTLPPRCHTCLPSS